MHEHDVAAVHGVESFFDPLSRTERTPVDRADIPQHHFLSASLRFVTHASAIATMRRTIETRRDANHIAQGLGPIANLRTRGSSRHEPRMAMAVSVIAERMSGR